MLQILAILGAIIDPGPHQDQPPPQCPPGQVMTVPDHYSLTPPHCESFIIKDDTKEPHK